MKLVADDKQELIEMLAGISGLVEILKVLTKDLSVDKIAEIDGLVDELKKQLMNNA